MTPEQHMRVMRLFDQLKSLPLEQRRIDLASACPDDFDVRAKVEKMLEHDDQKIPTSGLRPKVDSVPQTPIGEDDRIGQYRILRTMGEGGMGVVYEAEQDKPKRTVALKVIKVSSNPERMRLHFDREIEALGQLQHPGIAQIFDAGIFDTDSGPQPFFAMELIEGESLALFAAERNLGTRQRLELMTKICGAVQHAHQKGVIHRDLKPANILVNKAGHPKILDFGLASATDSDMQAAQEPTEIQVAGTIRYMSPEQTTGCVREIDTRSDVYALGVMTYELLTGELPHELRDKDTTEALRIVREDDPSRLSSIDRTLRGDVEWVVAKALEKDKNRRYGSAAEFAADLIRLLKHEPVVAGPGGALYRFRKFVRRHRLGVTAAAVIVLAMLTATGVSTRFGLSEAEQRRIAEGAQKQAEDNLELAQKREREATEARDRTKIVADFQSSMLGETDAEGMGLAIVDGLEDRIRAALAQRIEDQGELDRVMHEWRQQTLKAGPTTVALAVLDEFMLAKAAETIEKDFADQPLVRAALQQTVAKTYRDIGLYEPAMPLQEAALKTRRQQLGDEHPDTLRSINKMGLQLQAMGKYDEALPYYREALESGRRVLGNDHPDTLTSINNLGFLLQAIGRLGEAEPYYREALRGRRRVLGNDQPGTLISIGSIGRLLQAMGHYEQALPYLSEALNGRRRALGNDHQHTLTSIDNMGFLLQAQGKYEEALFYYREALESRRRTLGDDHPATLTSVNHLGNLLHLMGKYGESLPYYRQAMETNRRILGDDHPNTLTSINNMGLLLKSMGKYEEALPYYHESLEGYRGVFGDDHLSTLISINNMGALLSSMGKYEEALPFFHEALASSRRVLGDDHPDTLTSINNMGALFKSMGNLSEAETYYREALEGFRRVLGDDHPNTLTSINNMGGLLMSIGKLSEAEPYYRQAMEGSRRVLGDDHPDTLISIYSMGRLLRYLGRLEESEALGAEAVSGARAKLPPQHPFLLATLVQHALTLSGMKRFAEAEGELLEAYGVYVETRGHDDRDTTRAAQSLTDLYDAWDKAEPDQGHDANAAEWRAKLPAAARADSLIKFGMRLLEDGRHAEAEAALRECLEIRREALAEGHWLIFNTMSVLGESLAGQGADSSLALGARIEKLREAESLLLEGYEGMREHPDATDERKREALQRIVKLYEAWHAAEPGEGYDAKADEWRAKLNSMEPTTQPK